VITSVHNTPFGDINDVEDDLQPLIYSAVHDATRAVALFAGTIESATFNLDILHRRAGENFITVTELADTIVRRENLSFRIAHSIVAESVRAAIDQNSDITHPILQTAAREVLGRELSLSAEELQKTLSPENFVAVRTIYGGPAPKETRRALQVEREHAEIDEKWFAEKAEFLRSANQKLQETIENRFQAPG
jgi:argininosuccinate lyase